jgi:HK97 family phage major capsid protein
MHVKIKALRDAAGAAVTRQNAILEAAAADGNRDLTAAEQAEFDGETAKYNKAMADIVPLQQVAERTAAVAAVNVPAAATPEQRDVTGVLGAVTTIGRVATLPGLPATPKDPDGWKKDIGAYAWAAAKSKHNPRLSPMDHLAAAGCQQLVDKSHAAEEAEIKEAMDALGPKNPIVVRALTTLGGGGGDNLITTPMSSEFIEFLRAESAFMRAGPQLIPMPLGAMIIPGGNAGAVGTYHVENADLGYTQATTRQVSMTAKHIGANTALSNFLIETSPLAIPAIFGGDLADAIRQGMDSAGLRGDGTGANPTGLRSLTNGAHVYAAANATAPTLAQIDADVKGMLSKLDGTFIQKRRLRFLMSSRVFRYLQFMRDGISGYVFPGLQQVNPIWYDNIPVIVSDLIPSTLGVGTNESELYLGDFGHVMMGETRSLRLKASTEASYMNASAVLVSAFSKDETVISARASHDFDMRHTKAAVILTAVKWGG